MKYLYIAPQYGFFGGGEQYIFQLLEYWQSRGEQIVIVYDWATDDPFPDMGHRTYHIPGICERVIAEDSNITKELDRVLGIEKPDVVIMHEVFDPEVIDLAYDRAGVVYMVQTTGQICAYGLHGPHIRRHSRELCDLPLGIHCVFLCGLPLRSIIRSVRHPRWSGAEIAKFVSQNYFPAKRLIKRIRYLPNIVVFSEYVKSMLVKNRIDEEKIHVLPLFTTLPPLPERDQRITEPVILFVGRLIWCKGAEYVVRVMTKLRSDTKLVIVGDGPDRERLEEMVKQLDLEARVKFAGWIPNNELKDYYSHASVVVFPSVLGEAFGIVGIEAMAHARPVVAYNVGGVSQWLSDGVTGFLVTPRDIDEMAERIEQLIDSPELRREFGVKGRETVEKRFLFRHHIQALDTVIENAVSRRSLNAS